VATLLSNPKCTTPTRVADVKAFLYDGQFVARRANPSANINRWRNSAPKIHQKMPKYAAVRFRFVQIIHHYILAHLHAGNV
jgi:hypothetical protein